MAREHEVDFNTSILVDFVNQFLQLIQTNGLEKIVALRVLQNPDIDGLLEMTQGRANINLKPGQCPNEL